MGIVTTCANLLLNFDSDILDESGYQVPLVYGAGISISDTEVKFGSKSCLFSGGSIDGNIERLLESKFWVFEGWFFPTLLSGTYHILFDTRSISSGLGTSGRLLIWLNSSNQLRCNVIGTGADAIASGVVLNQWNFLQVTSDGQIVTCRVSGGNVVQNGGTSAMTSGSFKLGQTTEGGNYFYGYADSIRFTVGINRSIAVPQTAFTPDLILADRVGRGTVVGAVPVVAPAADARARQVGLDVYHGGRYRIASTVKAKGSPSNIPLHRRVQLIRERGSLVIRETWSDPVTGAYSFDGISGDYTYTVVSYDYTHNYRAVIADNLTPELMP